MGFRVALGLGPDLAGDPTCEMRRVPILVTGHCMMEDLISLGLQCAQKMCTAASCSTERSLA